MPGGYGRGHRHRWWYKKTGMPGWMRYGPPPDFESGPPWGYPPMYPPEYPGGEPFGYPEIPPKDELKMLEEEEQMLEEEESMLKTELEEIKKRIEELKKEVK